MATPPTKSEVITPQYEETHGSKLWRKTKEAPFVPIGLAGLVGACAWGAYKYRSRGQMSTSIYLMQLRVIAQGMVVGAITIGVGYTILRESFSKSSPKDT